MQSKIIDNLTTDEIEWIDLILNNFNDNNQKPTFNMVLTNTYFIDNKYINKQNRNFSDEKQGYFS